MRNFKPHDSNSYPLTRDGLFNGPSYALCKHMKRSQLFILQIENIIDLSFGNNQRMSFHQRIDIKKSKKVFILSYFVTRNVASNNLTKNTSIIDYIRYSLIFLMISLAIARASLSVCK